MLNGPLSDFYSISLNDQEPTFLWHEIPPKGTYPASRSKHALLGGKTHIFLVGGLLKNDQASNEMFRFDPVTSSWDRLQPEGAKLPALESFSAVLVSG